MRSRSTASSNPSPALTAPRPAGRGRRGVAQRNDGELRGLGASARREATNVRLAEEAFYRDAQRIAALSLPAIAESTRGATVVYRDPLAPLLSVEKSAEPLAYAVVSVRRNGERSPLSNIVRLTPDVAPGRARAPAARSSEEGRVCLEWLPPKTDVLGRPAAVGGYRVYRRTLSEEEYGAPLTRQPVAGTAFVDAAVPYGVPLVYTVRATLEKNPKVEGLPAEEVPALPARRLPAAGAVPCGRAVRSQPRPAPLGPGPTRRTSRATSSSGRKAAPRRRG